MSIISNWWMALLNSTVSLLIFLPAGSICFWHRDVQVSSYNSGGLVSKSCLTLLWHHELQRTRLLCPWDFPGENPGVGCHFLLQGIVPTQESNRGLVSPALLEDSLPWATREVFFETSMQFLNLKHWTFFQYRVGVKYMTPASAHLGFVSSEAAIMYTRSIFLRSLSLFTIKMCG